MAHFRFTHLNCVAIVHLTHTWERYDGRGSLDHHEEFVGADGEFLIAGLSPSLLGKVKRYLWENDPMYNAKERIAYRNMRLDGDA